MILVPIRGCPNPGTPFQDAVDAASPGDEIVVTNGVYRAGVVEANGLNRVVLTKPVAFRSF
jgi:hypothetical protein